MLSSTSLSYRESFYRFPLYLFVITSLLLGSTPIHAMWMPPPSMLAAARPIPKSNPTASCIEAIIQGLFDAEIKAGNYPFFVRMRARSIRKKIEETIQNKCPTPDNCTHEELVKMVQDELVKAVERTSTAFTRTRRALFRVAIATLAIAGFNYGLTQVVPPMVAATLSTFVGVIIAAPVNAVMSSMMEPLASWVRKQSFRAGTKEGADKERVPDTHRSTLESIFFRANERLRSIEGSARGIAVDTQMLTNGFLTTAIPALETLLRTPIGVVEGLSREKQIEFIAADIAAAAIMIRSLFTEVPELDRTLAMNVGLRLRSRLAELPDRNTLLKEVWARIQGDRVRKIPAHDPTVEPEGSDEPAPVRDYYHRLLNDWFGDTDIGINCDIPRPRLSSPKEDKTEEAA